MKTREELMIEGYQMLMMGGRDAQLQMIFEMANVHPNTFLHILGLSTDEVKVQEIQELLLDGQKIKATKAVASLYELSMSEAKEKVEEILSSISTEEQEED